MIIDGLERCIGHLWIADHCQDLLVFFIICTVRQHYSIRIFAIVKVGKTRNFAIPRCDDTPSGHSAILHAVVGEHSFVAFFLSCNQGVAISRASRIKAEGNYGRLALGVAV